MKLEVGMYVRTKYGDMFILDKIEDNCLIPRNVYIPCIIIEEDVKKASHNIIDLIEVRDYVNGYKIIKISTDHCGRTILIYGYDNGDRQVAITIYEDDIKSIVTKEQFESMAYRMGE